MNWQPLGDTAFISECADAAAVALSLRKSQPPECLDIVPSYQHLAIHFSPPNHDLIKHWLSEFSPDLDPPEPSHQQIPIWYDPELISALADQLSLTCEEIINLHQSTTFRVAAIGFSPGFPYLTGLPTKLHLPRKETPTRLPAGTVAIAADQAGIYPNDSFGGWHPLGITDTLLFDPETPPHCPLQPGDEINFVPLKTKPVPTPTTQAKPSSDEQTLIIESAGPATSLQAPGRPGYRHLGVTAGSPADPEMASALNLLLGNAEFSPVLEFALEAPLIRFLKHTEISFLGPYHHQAGQVLKMKAGQVLDLRTSGPMQSSFGYLAIKGGFQATEILGSCATDLRARFGGKAIKSGDSLHALNSPPISHSNSAIRWPLLSNNTITIRILPGEQDKWFNTPHENLPFRKSTHYDRTAARLEGEPLKQIEIKELTSRPVVAGAIQVPPDGTPTVLLSECQTIGGYPIIGHIISADLPAFTRAKPGTTIHFQKITLTEAHRAYQKQQRDLAFLRTGLILTQK